MSWLLLLSSASQLLYHRAWVNSSIHDDHDNNKDNDNDHYQISSSHVGGEIVFYLDCFCCMSCLQVVKLKWQCLLKPSYLGSQGHKFNDMLASIAILCAGVPLLQSKSGPVLPLLNCSTILHTACLPSTNWTLIFLAVAIGHFHYDVIPSARILNAFVLPLSFVIMRLKTGLWLF